jgi:hypothetical protein
MDNGSLGSHWLPHANRHWPAGLTSQQRGSVLEPAPPVQQEPVALMATQNRFVRKRKMSI